jgi:Sec-independent protein secretion pathway component TatC
MYIFYEIAVVIGRVLVRKKNKDEESSSTEPNEAAV